MRFGSAEIYDAIEHCFAPTSTHAAHTIVDCLAVGQSIGGGADERVVLFVKLLEGQVLTHELEKRIKTEVRARRSARHVPARVSTIDFKRPCSGLVIRQREGMRLARSLKTRGSFAERSSLQRCSHRACVAYGAVQIIQVADIPYTVNMKRVEVPVKKVTWLFTCRISG